MSSVDDLEELIATRRLHGLNDGLFKEETMTEEAFNELIDNFEVAAHLTMYGRKGIKDNVKKLQSRIKELEESNRIYALNGSNIKLELYIKENYIPVQKVKDKIEEVYNMKFKDKRLDCATIDFAVYKFKELLEEK